MAVTTHIHWDHIGGHKYFDNIAVHEKEMDWLSVKFPIPLQVVKNNLTKVPCNFPTEFNIDAYQIFGVSRKGFCTMAIGWIWAGGKFRLSTRRDTLPDIVAFMNRGENTCIPVI